MGIDFGKLIGNLGTTAASMQNDKSKIDTKTELNTYVSGWDAIKVKAEAENAKPANANEQVNIDGLESEMKLELAVLLGAEFGKSAGVENKGTEKEPFFSEDEISLENMMSLLSAEDGVDIDKLREENKKPMLSAQSESVESLTEAGFDAELVNIMAESTPGAVKYISDAIKSGRAQEVSEAAANDAEEFDTPETLETANLLRTHSRFEKSIARARDILSNMQAAFQARTNALLKKYNESASAEEKAEIMVDLMAEDVRFEEERTRLEAMIQLQNLESQTELKPEEE
ncbi:MAG: hypothetical protein K6E29_05435 [Cyanobacteria bacterium RUI128]|nr:hypothetical protein [Cyanobacteria bacterium RUI128]